MVPGLRNTTGANNLMSEAGTWSFRERPPRRLVSKGQNSGESEASRKPEPALALRHTQLIYSAVTRVVPGSFHQQQWVIPQCSQSLHRSQADPPYVTSVGLCNICSAFCLLDEALHKRGKGSRFNQRALFISLSALTDSSIMPPLITHSWLRTAGQTV